MKKTVKIILFIVFIFFIHLAIARDLEITVIYDNNPYNKELIKRYTHHITIIILLLVIIITFVYWIIHKKRTFSNRGG